MPGKVTVSIQTLGCKLNQAEAEAISRELTGAGFEVTTGDKADAFILNTCTVTHIADRKGRHLVRLLRKSNPQALIVVTGCYAQRAAGDIKGCGADLVVNNAEKRIVAQILQSKLGGRNKSGPERDRDRTAERVRSFIKVQDGCRNFCSYCIVPLVRNNVYSLDADKVVGEIQDRVRDGYREVVLTGTEIGSYNDNGADISRLIQRILEETGVMRIHLSSLQPQEITPGLLELWQDRRLCRHFHIALQSGSDTVLERMRRRYNRHEFEKAVTAIRDIIPDASVTTDVMVGFPGESEAEFRESYEFCKAMKFSALHVFSYSPRPGTLAAGMSARVDEKTKKQRSLQMLELAAISTEKFSGKFTGKTREVLWENEVRPGSGIYSGLTDNYIRAYTGSQVNLTNTISVARMVQPAREMDSRILKASTKGNYGEFWSEVVNENQGQGNAQLGKGRGG
jgi:threonylcarbamoyladenosine tRNA methylthiotransferase MtaB